MKIISKGFFLMTILFLGTGQSFSPAETNQSMLPMRVFESKADGFRVFYPSDWEEDRFNGKITAFIAPQENTLDNFEENINFIKKDLSGDVPDLGTFSKICLEQIRREIPGAQILDSSPTTLGGMPAYQAVFLTTLSKIRLKFMQVWTLKGHQAYFITYAAEENNYFKYLGVMKKIMNSFQCREG